MEQRTTQRRRVLKAGSIEFDGRTVDCTLRNISPTGAALSVASHLGIPHEFTLNIAQNNIRQNCRVVWRKETLIGLAFECAARST
jgi:PilZ domain